jgi:endonuclease-8
VGSTVESVEARGKHLLMGFDCGLTLHCHLRMTGSWHVYPVGERWRKPARQARLVLEAGDRLAVCFNAPVLELVETRRLASLPSLAGLGPDVLAPGPLDLGRVRARARARAPERPTVGELLLDQGVAAGIGNIYRCETLFICRVSPDTPSGDLDDATIDRLWSTASRLMAQNAAGSAIARDLGGGPERPWVYRRTGRPCRRCGTLIRRAELGREARTVYWCPACQPPRKADGAAPSPGAV